jgi:hypothetical protein
MVQISRRKIFCVCGLYFCPIFRATIKSVHPIGFFPRPAFTSTFSPTRLVGNRGGFFSFAILSVDSFGSTGVIRHQRCSVFPGGNLFRQAFQMPQQEGS